MPENVLSSSQLQGFEFETCYARLAANELIAGNSFFERQWKIENGLLYSRSFRDHTTGYEWLAGTSSQPSPYTGLTAGPGEIPSLQISASTGKANPLEEPSLLIELTATTRNLKRVYRFQIFPAARGVKIQVAVEKLTGHQLPASELLSENLAVSEELSPTGIEQDELPISIKTGESVPDVLDEFELADRHLKLTQVIFREQTDHCNELVFENEWLLHPSETLIALEGNLFILENTLTRAGLIFLKQAPLPYARPIKTPYDLEIKQTRQTTNLAFYGHGIGNETGEGYAYSILAYTDGRYIEVLQTYQRQLRAYKPTRDGLFLTNTWGDRGRDGRISEAFLELEIDGVARLGADVIQIDDGWQAGTTANSVNRTDNGVWEGFWAANQAFWSHHPERLPNGLAPLIAKARQRGLQFGLWFAPDSSDDFAKWRLDANTIIGFYRQFGITYIKVDAVKLRSKLGEANLVQFYYTVQEETCGEVVFDSDVTAEVRPGYFGQINTGPIFIENRYTDWHNYWPHQTLRNLWKLAHYIDPLRLRIEFLNSSRNTELYANDPLAPACYSPAYLFAITMVSNPLGWFETSNLPSNYFTELAPLVTTWKTHRQRLAQGSISPIGNAPDGTEWTGFASVNEAKGEGYLLIFRELNNQKNSTFRLPMFSKEFLTIEILWGNGMIKIEEGQAKVEIAAPQQFLLVHLQFC